MTRFRHSIRKQTLEVDVSSEALALQLQPRMGDINRKHLLPVIERVLDELAVPGRQIKIARLEIDLGTLSLSGFEEEVEKRLYRELRQAVEKALREIEAKPTEENRSQPEEVSRRELLEHYLLHGTLPFWAPDQPTFSLDALFQELIEGDAEGLARLLRQHGHLPHVLERVVAQLDTSRLERLLGLLEPEHAALVIDYIFNLKKIHQVKPVLPLSDRAFSRVLWSLALGYVVRDPGTQFNRKSSVKSLLQGIAESHGLDYRDILATLRLGLEQTQKNYPIRSSLPAVIGELVHESDLGTGKQEDLWGPQALQEAMGQEELTAAIADRKELRDGVPLEEPSDAEEGSAEMTSGLRRYDVLDALRYYLRHGVLPWSVTLRAPELTAEHLLASLPELPTSLLRTVFPRGQAEEQLSALLRAVRGMPEQGLEQLLLRLLPGMRDAESPLRTALSKVASRSQDKPVFYARLLSSVLEERPIDLEALAAPGAAARAPESALPESLQEWEAHVLESALVNRLRYGAAASGVGPTSADLLETLISTHPPDARQFLRALRDATPLETSLFRVIPAPLFDRVIELLCPDEAETLQALTRALTELPAPYLQGSEAGLRQALFHEVLRLEEGKPLEEASFGRVLREIFGASLPEAESQSLFRAVITRAPRGRLPATHVAPLEAALRSLSEQGRSEPREEEREEVEAREEPSSEEPVAREPRRLTASVTPLLREAVFTFLLGERRTPTTQAQEGSQSHARQQGPLSDDTLQHMLRRMMEESPEEVHALLRQHLADPHRRERWVKLLPESGLARLCHLLEPRKHRALLESAEVLAEAWQEVAPPGQPALTGRQAFWGFVLEFLSQNAAANRSMDRLASAFFEHFAARYRSTLPGAPEEATVGERLLKRASELARTAGQTRLVSVLRRDRAPLARCWGPNVPPRREPSPTASATSDRRRREAARPRSAPENQNTAFKLGGKKGEDDIKDALYIHNAGLVLTNPFLPHFFQELDMLRRSDGGKTLHWKDPETVSRAVHLLQYLVDGQASAPEPTLVLNKVLCGVEPSIPIDREITPTDQELATCEQLLKSLIENWRTISNTSIAGLRETFLQRQGRLHFTPEGWKLLVQRKTLDLLVDQIPWSISIVSHRWMPKPIYVTW